MNSFGLSSPPLLLTFYLSILIIISIIGLEAEFDSSGGYAYLVFVFWVICVNFREQLTESDSS